VHVRPLRVIRVVLLPAGGVDDGVAECYDNAVAESVFGSLKGEWVDHHRYADLAEARASIRVYLQWFNTERRHQSLDYLTPDEKENMFDTHLHPDPPASPTATVAVAG